MADLKEIIFRKDSRGNWKVTSKEESSDNGSGVGCLVFLIILLVWLLRFVILFLILTVPMWISLIGFIMFKTKRFYVGIVSLVAFFYILIDMKKGWALYTLRTHIMKDYTEKPILSFSWLPYDYTVNAIYILNAVGVLLGLCFIFEKFLSKQYNYYLKTGRLQKNLKNLINSSKKSDNEN